MKKRIAPIPNTKIKVVKELEDLIKNKKTILIASINNLPGSKFQEISKKLRDNAIIKVPKKNLIFLALDNSNNEMFKKLKEHIQGSVALLFSDLDSFELAAELNNIKSLTKAKTGQEAPTDIEIQEGPTELVPGPAISELGALGIQIQIKEGKIHIKEPKIIVKQGEKISKNAAELMSKLDIKPFSVGFIPLSAMDIKENKLYLEIKVDKEGTLKELKRIYSKALAFAVEKEYISLDTIKYLIKKAVTHEKALEKLKPTGSVEKKQEIKEKEVEENNKNEKVEETIEEKENVQENNKEEKVEEENNKNEKNNLQSNKTKEEPKEK